MVEDEDEEEEIINFCRMIVVDIEFQDHNVEISQDNCSRSNAIMSTYRIVKLKIWRELLSKYGTSTGKMEGSLCPRD